MYRGGQERATTVFVNTVEALSWFEVVSVVVLVKTDAIMNAEMQESLKETRKRDYTAFNSKDGHTKYCPSGP